MTDKSGLSVLHIEDDPDIAFLVTVTLNNAQTGSVQVADTLAKGLASLDDGEFDIVLLDLTLPDSSGIERFKTVFQAHAIAGVSSHWGSIIFVWRSGNRGVSLYSFWILIG